MVLYYIASMHHIGGCDEHPGCEKYKETQYRTSHMWPWIGHLGGSQQPVEKLEIPPLRIDDRFFWGLLICATTVSLIGNITHAVLPYIPRIVVQIGAAAVPPIALLAAVPVHPER